MGETTIKLLTGENDRYNGIIVDTSGDNLPQDPVIFEEVLKASLQSWKEGGKRGCWLKIPQDKATYISIALKNGFTYHHTQQDYCMLTTWMSADKNKIPNYANHYIGVGGVVMNDKNQILTVTEKYLRHIAPGFYKLPGGAVDPGEDITAAVQREIFEETGITAKFEEMICFRQQTNFTFGLTDIYFICKLKAETYEIKKDDDEIEDCKWLDFEEFMKIQAKYPMLQEMSLRIQENVEGKVKGMVSKKVANGFRPDPGTLFYTPQIPPRL